MIRLLVRKQLREIFRNYFYDVKHSRARSKGRIILFFAFFVLVMAGMLGGIFTYLATQVCEPMAAADMSWLYFTLFGLVSIFLGAFGSVFNTYSGLYLAKDNDFLFSMPVPIHAVIFSRVLTVYLMGLMYSACVLVPALAVYWIRTGPSFSAVLGGLLLLLDVSIIDLVLSCLFGYVIARLSLKLKNKGFITALVAVAGIALYYFVYFHLMEMLQNLVQNLAQIGAQVRGASEVFYVFGATGTGDWRSIAFVTAVCLAALALTWFILQHSFLKVATSTGAVKKAVYREKTVRRRSVLHALIARELKHFTASATYMLNCGLGVLFLVLAGAALLWQGGRLVSALGSMFGGPQAVEMADAAVVVLCAMLCLMGSMIDTAAPSVSLEGKSLWLIQSLPVRASQALSAKLCTQLILGAGASLFAAVCAAVVLRGLPEVTLPELLLFILDCLLFQLLMACWNLFWGVLKARTDWSSEIYPIKQSLAVFAGMFGGFFFALLFGGIYLWQRTNISAAAYLAVSACVMAAASAALLVWLKGPGARRFAELH